MTAVNVLLQHFGVKRLVFWVVPREALLGMRDEETTIACTLHGTKDTGTGGGALKSDVEVALEWSAGVVAFKSLGEDQLSSGFLLTFVLVAETDFIESTASHEEAGRVS